MDRSVDLTATEVPTEHLDAIFSPEKPLSTTVPVADQNVDEDLTRTEKQPSVADPLFSPSEKRLDQREEIRGQLASALVVILGVVVAFAGVWLCVNGKSIEDLKSVMGLIFGPIIALVGTALGFYFGGIQAKEDKPSP
jgi:hypothetical protein